MAMQGRSGSTKFRKGLIFFGLLCIGAVVFYKPLVLAGCRAALKVALPEKEGRSFSYERLEWEEGAVVLTGLVYKDAGVELACERIAMRPSGDLLHLVFQPEIAVLYPQMRLLASDDVEAPLLPFLYRSRFVQPRFSIVDGIVEFPTATRFYFSMTPSEEPDAIGDFVLCSDPAPGAAPLLSAHMAMRGTHLETGFKLQTEDVREVLPLSALFFPKHKRNWEKARGALELEGVLLLDSSQDFEELHCRALGQKLLFSGSEVGIDLQCDEALCSFSFPTDRAAGGFWEKLSASLEVRRGSFVCAEPLFDHAFGAKDLEGQFVLEPGEEPTITFTGALVQEKRKLPFSLSGVGGLHEDAAFWAEATLVCRTPGKTEMQAALSFSSQGEGDFAFHGNVESAEVEHIDFFRAFAGAPGECIQGSVAGQATLLYRGGRWESASVETRLLKKLGWSFPDRNATVFAEGGQGEGVFDFTPGSRGVLRDARFALAGAEYRAPDLHASAADLRGEASLFKLRFGGEDFEVKHAQAQFELPRIEPLAAECVYDPALGQWEGHIPLSQGVLHSTYGNLTLAGMEGELQVDGAQLTIADMTGELEGLALSASLALAMSGGDDARFLFSTSRVDGKVQGLLALLAKLPGFSPVNFPLDGSFSCGPRGFSLSVPLQEGKTATAWRFEGEFSELAFPVNSRTRVKEGQCSLSFDSLTQRLQIQKGMGSWELTDGSTLNLQIDRLSRDFTQGGGIDLAVKVLDGRKECAQIEGKALPMSLGQWELSFAPESTHFMGTRLQISRCVLGAGMQIASFEMKPLLLCKDLPAQTALLQKAGFLSPTFSPRSFEEWGLDGSVQTHLFSTDVSRGLSLRAESSDLKIKGRLVPDFLCRAHKRGDVWQIEHLRASGTILKGDLVINDEGFFSPKFEGDWSGLALKGSGSFRTKGKQFSCTFESVKGDLSALKSYLPASSLQGSFVAGIALKGDLGKEEPLQMTAEANLLLDLQAPIPLLANNKTPLKFRYATRSGLTCEGIDLLFKHKTNGMPLAMVTSDKFSFQSPDAYKFEEIEFFLMPACLEQAVKASLAPAFLKGLQWEGNLEGKGEFEVVKGKPIFQSNLKAGRYGFEGTLFPFEQLHIRYEDALLSLRAKALVENQPLWASLQLDIAKEPYGMLKVFDHPKAEGLKILFKTEGGKITFESAQGSCHGLSCSLAKSSKRKVPSATVLTGEVQVDGNQLTLLLPQAIREGIRSFKWGAGYGWQGDLVLYQDAKQGYLLNGRLRGKECELLGYQFQGFEASIDATPAKVTVSGIKIEDPSGAIALPKVELQKKGEWELYIPELIVRNLQPSAMRKVGSAPTPIKPFMIKNFTLSEVRGRLGDRSSLTGDGHLLFVNQAKKESSLFEVPLEILKKIGLDPGLLTPVQGELQIELRGDKFYLISLDNAFSDGDRSEFYLSPGSDLSFIDLEGKMYINLKMRQDVVLKITEAFTLTIRGTLEKPKYGLQF